MCLYAHQISFTSSAWHALMADSSDPLRAIRGPIESLGGKLLYAFFTEDSYDVLAITEFPEKVSADKIAIGFYAEGAVAHIHSSVLLTATQADEAKRKSGTHSYRVTPRAKTLAASAS
jgi:uncharacterized protein with GYD domain